MKKILNLFWLAACVFCMTVFFNADVKAADSAYAYDEDAYVSAVVEQLEVLSEVTDEEIVATIEAYADVIPEAYVNQYNSWMGTRSEVGAYVGILESKTVADNGTVTVILKVDYELRDCEVKMSFDKNGEMTLTTFNPIYSLGEKMSKAGLNTVIGLVVVFVVLILISLLIGCFKYINIFEQSLKNKKENKTEVAVAAVENTIAQIVQKEEEELVDDLELVAVIAAAIAASTGTSTDGFVVRSIKKSNKKRWQNA